MASKFTFVHQNQRVRRVRSRRACEACRNRKRRCIHHPLSHADHNSLSKHGFAWRLEASDKEDSSRGVHSAINAMQITSVPAPEPNQEMPLPSPTDHSEPDRRMGEPASPAQQQAPELRILHTSPTPRFVGDLNPEARLLDESATPDDSQDTTTNGIGVWVQPRKCSNCSPSGESCSPIQSIEGRPPERSSPVSDLISEETMKVLSDIYFTTVHPIIPILNEHEYRQSLRLSHIQPALAHAVCIVAAKDHSAQSHLRLLQSGEALVSVRHFCSRLHASIVPFISNRKGIRMITQVRLLALASLHHEGVDGAEQASSYIALAVHCAQSLALHLTRPRDDDSELKRTFWCLWTLDRLNAAMHSRPCFISDIDIAIEPLTPAQSGSVAFDIWFRIAQMLNNVIGLYRPTNPESMTGWDFQYAGFEQIVDELEGWHLSSATIGTLHIFFLATATLAHRLKSIKTLPTPTPARLRQQLSAIQIIRYTQDPHRLQSLHPLPVTVYATSLALSVSYQQLRYSRLSSDQEDARQDFSAACNILQSLRVNWSAADAIAALAHKISVELDKMPNLDLLRIDRSQLTGRGSKPSQQSMRTRPGSIAGQENDVVLPGTDSSVSRQEGGLSKILDDLEKCDLFDGMDDISWMYLDAENPVSFECLPLLDLDTQLRH
ncbi:hypothetical protein EDB81DRAFT_322935 [Dactylonectria macrodidyma]|uniref:Xylanolytic transcriptional activator regulatory domain-containing protein n=1 Tax=Dactylonectria macrodidyma TaxID=307937 RepID=A0A9P9JIZ1_9HYPO|nr:hypothetical protein EDB81DRAFT_322935 [Dactylonectria macrodidyma]